MNDERCDRDRVTAILTLAEAATPGAWEVVITHGRDYTDEGYSEISVLMPHSPDPEALRYRPPGALMGDHDGAQADAAFIAAARSEAPWLARRLLEALDTIDKARALHFDNGDGDCVECGWAFPLRHSSGAGPQRRQRMSDQAKFGDRVTIGDGRDHWLVMGPGDCPSRYHLMRHDFHVMAFIDDLRVVERGNESGDDR